MFDKDSQNGITATILHLNLNITEYLKALVNPESFENYWKIFQFSILEMSSIAVLNIPLIILRIIMMTLTMVIFLHLQEDINYPQPLSPEEWAEDGEVEDHLIETLQALEMILRTLILIEGAQIVILEEDRLISHQKTFLIEMFTLISN
jgi:hypothetical protein